MLIFSAVSVNRQASLLSQTEKLVNIFQLHIQTERPRCKRHFHKSAVIKMMQQWHSKTISKVIYFNDFFHLGWSNCCSFCKFLTQVLVCSVFWSLTMNFPLRHIHQKQSCSINKLYLNRNFFKHQRYYYSALFCMNLALKYTHIAEIVSKILIYFQNNIDQFCLALPIIALSLQMRFYHFL